MVEEQGNAALSDLSEQNAKDNIKLKEEIYQLKQEIQNLQEIGKITKEKNAFRIYWTWTPW